MRQRNVVDKSEVAHLWANKAQDQARNAGGNFYFSGNTIYSYGSHFPIAIHHKDAVIMTLRTYSNTTSGHVWEVRRAVSHKNVVLCLHPEKAVAGNHEGNINYWINNITETAKKLIRARKPQIHMQKIAQEKAELTAYLEFFGIKLKKSQEKQITFATTEEFVEATKKAAELEKRETAAKRKLGEKVYHARIKAWKTDGSYAEFNKSMTPKQGDALSYFMHNVVGRSDEPTYLRADNEQVFTSKGIKIPIDVARRYHDFYRRIVSKGGCRSNCNYKMLDYEVSEATAERLVIGCHSIPVSEIDYIAKKLNWITG